jgi:DNA-binding transcriptional MerR regulator
MEQMMFKIGDFAKLGHISVRMLRHYDKLGLLKPSHTDRFTSYRYYTIDQLARLHRIVALNGLGLTLQQIADLLGEDNQLPVDQLRGMLKLRQAELAQELEEKQAQIAGVAARLQQLEREGQPSPYEIVIKPLEPVRVVGMRALVPSASQMGAYCRDLYAQLYAYLARHQITPNGPELTIYHNEEFSEIDLDVETCAPIGEDVALLSNDSVQFHELPATMLAAGLIYEGTYREVDSAILSLLQWAGQHGYVPAGALRELHLSGPAHVGGRLVEPAVLELQLPLRKASIDE